MQDEFTAIGAQIIGVSFDSPAKNAAFKSSDNFKFSLWSDVKRELAIKYGAATSVKQSTADRVTVILDPAGNWLLVYPQAQVNMTLFNHPGNCLADIKALIANQQ